MPLIKIPGLIDVHVHLREPGATHKEDFYTGSRAAIAGGFTFIIDMPNNPLSTITKERLEEKVNLSKDKAICEIGFHFGTNGKNIDQFPFAIESPNVYGLKVYCNHTTGEMLIEDKKLLEEVFSAWNSEKPILVHAEGEQLANTLAISKKYNRHLHVCHISQKSEVEMVRLAKKNGENVTAGVTPHHLYMTNKEVEKLKGYAMMKPPLGTEVDKEALWEGLKDGTIDIVDSDHAPHTKEEKIIDINGKTAYGVPGLETTLGLMYKAVFDKKILNDDVIKFLYTNPKNIFNIKEQVDTYVELDPSVPYTVGEKGYETKCGWSPFEGMTLYGKPQKVVLMGKTILENGKMVIENK
jgi:carbamoyl-phosphate synthase/aspartate carbamoyltransferase/dihydroorotase